MAIDTVLVVSGRMKCSALLQKRQSHLYKKIAGLPSNEIIKMFVCEVDGVIVDTAERPDTLAKYFANVTWQVRFAELLPTRGNKIHESLQIKTGKLSTNEFDYVLNKLKVGKANGHDDVPPEFWKYVQNYEYATNQLLDICNHCWSVIDIPQAWRVA